MTVRVAPWKCNLAVISKLSSGGDAHAAFEQHLPAHLGSIGKAEELEIVGVDHAGFGEVIEIDRTLPKSLVEQDDGQRVVHLAGLAKGQDLEQFIERAEAAGKDDERCGAHREMHLAHREIVEAEGKFRRRIGIWLLLASASVMLKPIDGASTS